MKFENITPDDLACWMGQCPSVHRSLTPEDLECAATMSCPSLHEVTPAELQCAAGLCPSVHETKAPDGSADLLIVGKIASPEFYADTPTCNPGEGEQAIVISERYFAKWLEEKIKTDRNQRIKKLVDEFNAEYEGVK